MVESGFNKTVLTVSATITITSSLLSIVGGVLVIWSYVVVIDTRNRVRGLLVALTIADLFTALGNGFGSIRWYIYRQNETHTADVMCLAQSFVTTTSSMASFLWTMSIAVYLFYCVWLRTDPLLTIKDWILLHIVIWGFPVGITLTAAIHGVLGNNDYSLNGVWCWINQSASDKDGILWMLISGKGWEILTYFFIATLYIMMKWKTYIERRTNFGFHWNQVSRELRREDEIYCLSCLILYCLRFWGTLRFILEVVGNEDSFPDWYYNSLDKAFLYLQSYGDCAQAFCNFILFFVCDKTVRSHIQNFGCRKLTKCVTLRPVY